MIAKPMKTWINGMHENNAVIPPRI